MKQSIYKHSVVGIDYTFTIEEPKDLREAFKQALATGYSVLIRMDFPAEIYGDADDYGNAKLPHLLIARAMLARGLVSEIVDRGDYYSNNLTAEFRLRMPTRYEVWIDGEYATGRDTEGNHCVKMRNNKDEIYNLSQHGMPEEWLLPVVKYKDKRIDSQAPYRKIADEYLREFIVDASRRIGAYHKKMSKDMTQFSDDKFFNMMALSSEFLRRLDVIRERRQAIFDDLFLGDDLYIPRKSYWWQGIGFGFEPKREFQPNTLEELFA